MCSTWRQALGRADLPKRTLQDLAQHKIVAICWACQQDLLADIALKIHWRAVSCSLTLWRTSWTTDNVLVTCPIMLWNFPITDLKAHSSNIRGCEIAHSTRCWRDPQRPSTWLCEVQKDRQCVQMLELRTLARLQDLQKEVHGMMFCHCWVHPVGQPSRQTDPSRRAWLPHQRNSQKLPMYPEGICEEVKPKTASTARPKAYC